MSIQLENIKYRMPNGEYYYGTANMDKNGSGFLIREDYFDSIDFKIDMVSTAVHNYPDEIIEFVVSGFETTLDNFNTFLKEIDATEFMLNLTPDVSRCLIQQDKLTKCYNSGVFDENVNCKYTKVIYVKSIP